MVSRVYVGTSTLLPVSEPGLSESDGQKFDRASPYSWEFGEFVRHFRGWDDCSVGLIHFLLECICGPRSAATGLRFYLLEIQLERLRSATVELLPRSNG